MADIEIRKVIGNNLKKYREAAGYSSFAVYQAIGIQQSQIVQHELGYALPSLKTLQKYCALYNIESKNILPF